MAIEEQTARTVFKGDGSTRAFPVTWYLDAEENVIVKMTNVTTAQVKTLELGTDYTVTPSDDEYPTNGAVINYPKNSVTPALGSDYRLTVIRNVPYTQSFVFPNNTRLLPKNIEGGLDGLELQIQQLNDKADQSLRIPDGLDIDGEEFVSSLYDASESAKNSAEEAKETLEATKKQAQIIETTKNEAVADINNYTEQSYLNAKSVNIRQFQNFENLKNGQNFTDDLLIATQGFIAPGDGGNAQYYVMPEDSEEEADGYSVIDVRERISGAKVGSAKVGNARTTKYKNRKIGLLISNFVDVRWFGAKIDGITDDSEAFNRAVNFISGGRVNNIEGYTLYVPPGTMKINNQIRIDIGCMKLKCDGTVIDATGVTGGAILISSNVISNPYFYNNKSNYLEGFRLYGNKNSGTIGIEFDKSDAKISSLIARNFIVHDFDIGIKGGKHTYGYTFFACSIYNCNTCIDNPAMEDSGERMSFLNTSFFNSDLAINNQNPNGSMHFLQCSFDYNNQMLVNGDNCTAFVTDCHIEWDNIDNPHIVIGSGSSNVNIKGGYIVCQNTNYYSDYVIENNAEAGGCGLYIDGAYIANIKAKYLINRNPLTLKNIKCSNLSFFPFIHYKEYTSYSSLKYIPSNILCDENSTIEIDGDYIKWTRTKQNSYLKLLKKVSDSSFLWDFVLEIATNEELDNGCWVEFGYCVRTATGFEIIEKRGDVSIKDTLNNNIGNFVTVNTTVKKDDIINGLAKDEIYVYSNISVPSVKAEVILSIKRWEFFER